MDGFHYSRVAGLSQLLLPYDGLPRPSISNELTDSTALEGHRTIPGHRIKILSAQLIIRC